MLQRLPGILLVSLVVLLVVLMSPLLVAFYLLARLLEELSGAGAWYRRQKRAMQSGRPPLADAEFLRKIPVRPGEESLWLAVRHAMAESVGLESEAIRPGDCLADLWRMQWLGPDLMDLVFRLERSLGIKITRPSVERFGRGVHYGQDGEFRGFAEAVVRELREIAQVAPA